MDQAAAPRLAAPIVAGERYHVRVLRISNATGRSQRTLRPGDRRFHPVAWAQPSARDGTVAASACAAGAQRPPTAGHRPDSRAGLVALASADPARGGGGARPIAGGEQP